jgi:hypothetical protein
MDVLDSMRSCLGIAWITSDEDVTTFLRRNREAVFLLKSGKLPLLLPPFGASFTLCAYVWLGKQLFDGDNGNRMRRSDDIVCQVTSSRFVTSTSFPALTLGPVPCLCTWSFDVFEWSRDRSWSSWRHQPVGGAQGIDLVP